MDSVLNEKTQRKRRFSDQFIEDERNKLYRFRDIFRKLIALINQNQKMSYEKDKQTRDEMIIPIICSTDRSITEEECRIILHKIDEYNVVPFEVGQRVLARVNDLHTGTILASEGTSAYVQFDRPDLRVYHVKDIDMITFDGNNVSPPNESVLLNDIRDSNLNPQIKSLLGEDSEGPKISQLSVNNLEVS